MSLSLDQGSALFRLLSDTSRMRLLLLLENHALTVAELTAVTRMAQSRVSTHLARLQRAGLVHPKRTGNAAMFAASATTRDGAAAVVWDLLRERLDDPKVQLDRERAVEVVRARARPQSWAESVAGRMERHYSPGRTWEATAQTLIGLLDLGDVLDMACGDGVMAELISDHARSVTGIDISDTLIAAAQKRLKASPKARFLKADMHQIPLDDHSFDHVFLMHALTYTRRPKDVLRESARLLRPGGKLVVAALKAHRHRAAMEAYDHVNMGLSPAALRRLLSDTGFKVDQCRVANREERPPYFEVLTAVARRGR